MYGAYRIICIFCLVISSGGCVVHELASDQDQIRQTLLDLYTDQVMDNLVRASKGMPIIQLDYTNATGTLTMQESGTIGDSQATTHSNLLAIPAKTVGLTKTLLNTAMGITGFQHTNQVAVTATPVTTSNGVYDAYLQFLTLPGSLEVSTQKPPDCVVQICRKYGNLYYAVPVEYRFQFLRLSLVTTAQRGQPLAPPDSFFTVSLQSITANRAWPEIWRSGNAGLDN